ncbi:hypothetical protein C8A01DRAFT_48995 [Parachaetomium inaequale]|uniref:RING-type domain-containing protein n=1 Tax=Parachaetomium inaequale TaxID=2588326 RepID=A0AAN6PA94_9PEZI|nr:hypothetical protein C8A01DRAFT_48995 [Parachaetomium inaequale]
MDCLDGVDAQTLRLIIQTQLEDLQEIARAYAPKGKSRAGEHDARDDLIAAVDAYSADLTATAQVLADQAMGKSIAQAVDADADLISVALSEEDRLNQDRDLAFSLSGQQRSAADRRQSVSQQSFMSATTDEDTLERLRVLNGSSAFPTGLHHFEQTDAGRAESSSWAQSRRHGQIPGPPTAKPVTRICVACTDQHLIPNLITSLSCSHEYCQGCLKALFAASFTDETLFPPKCCRQPIPIDDCRALLTPAIVGQFNAKKLEFDTPNRTYCHVQACSAFVPPQFVSAGVAYCAQPGCSGRTCAVCKGASHVGHDCPEDPATQDMLGLAAERGWQRCKPCGRFVELTTGCNHITCRCGAQFCYVCGETWKTCRCDQWDEDNLLERATANVDRNVGAQPIANRQRADLVERERANLMENHQCGHASWTSRTGRYQCEECDDTLRSFIYECRQCSIMVCRRCRFNRL